MLRKDELIKVRNRDNGVVGYHIPEMNNLRRNFAIGETKEITMEELRKLSYIPGGDVILRECLVIENEEALNEILSDVEPEYFYTDEDIKTLLLSGSLEQLQDCLDFAPSGVIDLVKDYAVKLEINDISKRNAILTATGFNVTRAIEINHESQEDEVQEEKARRAAPINKDKTASNTTSATPKRRTVAKYSVKTTQS